MITEAYIKARCGNGVGKYAVVIVQQDVVIHKVAMRIGETFTVNDETLVADQYNCEIIAACYALDWCKRNNINSVNIYANTNTCQKWYYRKEIPQERTLGLFYDKYSDCMDVYADYIPKKDTNVYNVMMNDMALHA